MRAFIAACLALIVLAAGCSSKPAPRPRVHDVGTDISAPFTDNTTYEVQAGETLKTVAQKYYGDESRWKSIYNANRERLRSPEDLRPGMKILLPPKDLPAYYEYTVKPGDTLSKIALEWYGDKAKARIIAEENGLKDPDAINPGQILRIPTIK
jgi:nucleoid-associated protein YgaU